MNDEVGRPLTPFHCRQDRLGDPAEAGESGRGHVLALSPVGEGAWSPAQGLEGDSLGISSDQIASRVWDACRIRASVASSARATPRSTSAPGRVGERIRLLGEEAQRLADERLRPGRHPSESARRRGDVTDRPAHRALPLLLMQPFVVFSEEHQPQ